MGRHHRKYDEDHVAAMFSTGRREVHALALEGQLPGVLYYNDETRQFMFEAEAIDNLFGMTQDLPSLPERVNYVERLERRVIQLEAQLAALRADRPVRRVITPAQRQRIYERDLYRCRYCGCKRHLALLVLDHVHPLSKGGSDEDDNLATACRSCNAKKGDGTPEEAGMPLLPIGATAVPASLRRQRIYAAKARRKASGDVSVPRA